MNLAEAKTRLTIYDLWHHFGFEGEPRKSCRCPFHPDRSASFSIFDDGRAWNCFAGCGGGDAVTFIERATGLSQRDACRNLVELAGGSSVATAPRPPRPKPADVAAAQEQRRKTWPPFTPAAGHPEAIDALARLRHVSRAGVDLMEQRGLLRFGQWHGHSAWFVTDGAGRNAQARRMDGAKWEGIDAKAQTLPGSRAAWPIGARESLPFRFVLFCEGVDILAAHHFIFGHGPAEDTSAVAMLGASLAIHRDALPLFAGKRVRIMAHADAAGQNAAARWADQLKTIGADVDAADFTGLLMADGSPVKDLNDCTRLDPKQTPELETLIPR